MNKFNVYKAVIYGVLVWGIAALALWALAATSLSVGWTHGIVAAVLGVSAYLFALEARPGNVIHALGYGTAFAAIGLALDGLFLRNFDSHVFSSWQYWLGYALTFFAPFVSAEPVENKILHGA